MDQPGMVANPARSEMNRYEMLYFNVNQIKEVGDPSRDAYRYNVPVLYCTVLYFTVPYPTEKKEVEGVEISLLPMGPMNVPGYQSHLQQRCPPACGN